MKMYSGYVIFNDSQKLFAIIFKIEDANVFCSEALPVTLKNTDYYCAGSGNFIWTKTIYMPFNTIAFYGAVVIEIVVRVQKMCLSDFKTCVYKCVLISFLKV